MRMEVTSLGDRVVVGDRKEIEACLLGRSVQEFGRAGRI